MLESYDELKIELKRLGRHVNYLERRFDIGVGRDLASTLRNLLQMVDKIDILCAKNGWTLTFPQQVKTKAMKRLQEGSDRFPLTGSVITRGFSVSGVAFYNRALSADEIKELSKTPHYSSEPMTLRQWLNSSAWEFKINGTFRSVPRSEFIDRCANRLGGSHPMTVTNPDKEHWADNNIIELLNTQIAHMPAPFAVLLETSQTILKVLKPYLK